MKDEDFLLKLREDLNKARERKVQYQLAKVTTVSSILGVGVALLEKLHLDSVFYVLPFIAVAFDIFILGEAFVMERASNFIYLYKGAKGERDTEFKWEQFVRDYPDLLPSFASFAFSLASLVISASILWLRSGDRSQWMSWKNMFWFFLNLSFISLMKFQLEPRVLNRRWSIPEGEAAPDNSSGPTPR